MKYFILFTAFSFDKNIWRTDEKQILVVQKKKKSNTKNPEKQTNKQKNSSKCTLKKKRF